MQSGLHGTCASHHPIQIICLSTIVAAMRRPAGNLPLDCRERELEDLFYKYGRIVNIDLKLPPRPPGFAFIQFEDPRDAEEVSAGWQGRANNLGTGSWCWWAMGRDGQQCERCGAIGLAAVSLLAWHSQFK